MRGVPAGMLYFHVVQLALMTLLIVLLLLAFRKKKD